jgi:hypothetical protein
MGQLLKLLRRRSRLLLADSFTGVDGTAGSAHSPEVGPNPAAQVGTFKLLGNALVPNTNADGDQQSWDVGVSDYTVSYDGVNSYSSLGNTSINSLLVRYSDTSHYWLVEFRADNSTVTIYSWNSPTLTPLASGGFTATSGSVHQFRVVCSGQLIQAYVDGALICQVTNAAFQQTATKIAARLGKAGVPPGTASWDNLRVTAP